MNELEQALKDIDQSTDYPGMQKFYKQAATVGAEALLPGAAGMGALKYGSKAIPPMARQIGGQLGGVFANQMAGVTQPGPLEYALNAITPFGSGVSRRAAPFLWKFGTEAKGADTLNRIIPQELNILKQRYQPPVPAKDLFKTLEASRAHVPVPETRKTAKEEIGMIGKSLPGFKESYGKMGKQLAGVEQATKKTGFLPIDQYQRLMHDVGTHIQSAERAGGVEAKGYKSLYRALMDDLEKAPSRMTGADADTLGQARDAYKREKFLEEIAHIARPFTKRGQDIEQANVNKLINRLNDSEDFIAKTFKSSFAPDEQATIMNTLKTLNKIPAVPPGAGQSFGSGGFWKHEFPAIVSGGGLGYAAGHEAGAGVGMAIGAAIPPTSRMWRDFNLANNTEAGRAMIGAMYKQANYKLTPEMWAAIEAYAAAMGGAAPSAGLSTMIGK